jgi:hypothetical protein
LNDIELTNKKTRDLYFHFESGLKVQLEEEYVEYNIPIKVISSKEGRILDKGGDASSDTLSVVFNPLEKKMSFTEDPLPTIETRRNDPSASIAKI